MQEIKNKKWNGQSFRSEEETIFAIWLDTAKKHGLVEKWLYEPREYIVCSEEYVYKEFKTKSGKLRTHKYKVSKDHSYTPDFFVIFTEKFVLSYRNSDQSPLYYYQDFDEFGVVIYNYDSSNSKYCCMFDVKPSNMTWVRSISTSASTFYIKASLLWQSSGVIVNKLVVDHFMKKTFIPDIMAFMTSRKVKTRYKKFIKCKLESEIFSQKELF